MCWHILAARGPAIRTDLDGQNCQYPIGDWLSHGQAARDDLLSRGVEATEVQVPPWGSFTGFADPDGNTWAIQQLPPPGSYGNSG